MNATRSVRRVVVDAPMMLLVEETVLPGTPEKGPARARSRAIGICDPDLPVWGGRHSVVT